MNLSDIVEFRNHLDRFDLAQAREQATEEFRSIKTYLDNREPHYTDLYQSVSADIANIEQHINQFGNNLNSIRSRLQANIEELEPAMYEKSQQLYQEGLNDPHDYVLDRTPVFDNKQVEFINGRINLYCNWKRIGLIIRPGREEWIRSMVSLDPLYLVDTNWALLSPAIEKFNPAYQKRLRPYVITERTQNKMLSSLPVYQFDVVFVYNFFNFKSITVIEKYLTELFELMAFGGVMMFTLNDSDRSHGVRNVERNYCCYTPLTRVLEIARSIGYTVETVHFLDGATTWVEIFKPGSRKNLRGGQVLSEIRSKKHLQNKK